MARLSDEEIERGLAGLEGWGRHGDAIRRGFKLADFRGSVDFVKPADAGGGGREPPPGPRDLVAPGDRHDHHAPEGGLTENDFELARRIGELG
jgi:pterin-4a-carbinolamine dehydratase